MATEKPITNLAIIDRLLVRRRAHLPEIGATFSRLTFVGGFGAAPDYRPDRPKNPHQYRLLAFCRCACGTTGFFRLKELMRGRVLSCGCAQRDAVRRTAQANQKLAPEEQAIRTHLRHVISAAIRRCEDSTDDAYPNYGGRGIFVAECWREDIDMFETWARINGFEFGLTLDRRNNDGPYSPENCRWVGWIEQQRNRRGLRLLAGFGETKCLSEWIEDPRCVVTRNIVKMRLAKGETVEMAITRLRSRRLSARFGGAPCPP